MGGIKVNQEKIFQASELEMLCPFGAIVADEQGKIEITPACRVCKLCVRKGPTGVFEFVEEEVTALDRSAWNGILVYVEHSNGVIQPVTYELIGKAREMADKTHQPVYAMAAGTDISTIARIFFFMVLMKFLCMSIQNCSLSR